MGVVGTGMLGSGGGESRVSRHSPILHPPPLALQVAYVTAAARVLDTLVLR